MLTHILRTFKTNLSHLQPLFYSTSSIEIKPSFSNYLVESLGFTDQKSLSISSKLAKLRPDGIKKVSDFKFAANADSVVNFFKQNGFTDTQIRNVVSGNPLVLTTKVDKTLIPKFRALQDHGFSGSDIAQIVSVNVHLVMRGMDSTTLPAIRTVGQVLGLSYDEVVSFLKRTNWHMVGRGVKNMEMNVALLRSYGIDIDLIRNRILVAPNPFFVVPEMFKEAVIKIEHKLGIPRHSKMFLVGIHLFAGFRDKTIDSKIEAYKSFGWTESDVMGLGRRNPLCLTYSVLGIKKKLGFLMKELGYTPGYLAMRPPLFSYSLEKRIVPRHTILQVLKMKGLIREDYHLYNAVCKIESSFRKQFVLPFKEVHDLYSELTGCPLRLPTEEFEKENCEG